MKFLGVLTVVVLVTTAGLPKPVYADRNPHPLVGTAQARRTPVLFQLTIMGYTTAQGHMLALGSYAFSFIIPKTFDTEKSCEDFGDRTIDKRGYKSRPLPDGSRLLPVYSCDKLPQG